MIDTVWVLTVEHKHGHDTSVHSTPAGADARLLDYVQTWWDRRVFDDDGNPMPIPADPDEAIEAYFDSDGTEHEAWFIEEHRINTPAPVTATPNPVEP